MIKLGRKAAVLIVLALVLSGLILFAQCAAGQTW
jgi:hypothetical protein